VEACRAASRPATLRRVRTILTLLLACAVVASAPAAAEDKAQAQRDLIDAQIARFPKDADGGPRVFFVGFAGFGEERVFAEEIKLAAQRVGKHFGSSDLSVLLVNDRRDVATYPFASASSLRYTLNALARVMNRDEDVLFLALSSHGWKDATIAVSNTGMAEEALSARTVAELLAESAILWKVIVVSACYSGTFIEPLADDHTIVITASARNRTSFGCADTRDLTYFGEAFYRDALPYSTYLRVAFEAARDEIHRREKREDVTASRPQAYFGALIEPRLREIEHRSQCTRAALTADNC
jgi:hypothetical protein